MAGESSDWGQAWVVLKGRRRTAETGVCLGGVVDWSILYCCNAMNYVMRKRRCGCISISKRTLRKLDQTNENKKARIFSMFGPSDVLELAGHAHLDPKPKKHPVHNATRIYPDLVLF